MDPQQVTRLELSRGDRIGALVLGAAGGAVLGILLQLAWRWLEDETWLPFHRPAEILMSAEIPAVGVLRPVVLALVGLAAMAVWASQQPRLLISDTEIEVQVRKQRRAIRREQVAGVYLEGSHVIIDSVEGRRLFGEEIEGAKKTAAAAFRRHGYPWESREG